MIVNEFIADCHFDLGISSGHLPASNIRVPNNVNQSGVQKDFVRMHPFTHYPPNEWVLQPSQHTEPFVEMTFQASVIVRDVIIQQCNGSRIKLFRVEVCNNNDTASLDFVSIK